LDDEFIEAKNQKNFSTQPNKSMAAGATLKFLNDENIEFSKTIKNKLTNCLLRSHEENAAQNNQDLRESTEEAESNHTSYQELPSICSRKSQTMHGDQPTIQQSDANDDNYREEDEETENNDTTATNNNHHNSNKLLEREDTFEKLMFKKPFNFNDHSTRRNLNTSIQSLTSQCTIDSLAKRVQTLVGPIDYKKSSEPLDLSQLTAPSITTAANLNTSALSKSKETTNSAKHSVINYESIYKELDTIQDTLRIQHSFNKHLEKLTASRAEIKDLLSATNNTTSNERMSETSTYSSATKVSPLSYATSASSLENFAKPSSNSRTITQHTYLKNNDFKFLLILFLLILL